MTSATLSTRKRLFRLVESFPGLHLRELARQADLSEQLALYHLDGLVKDGLLNDEADGVYRRFYPSEGPRPDATQRQLVRLLRRPVPLQVAVLLLEKGPATNQELVEALGLAKSTVSYHLARLVEEGLLHRNATGAIALADPGRVRHLLIRWEPPRSVTDRFGDLWASFYGPRTPRGKGR